MFENESPVIRRNATLRAALTIFTVLLLGLAAFTAGCSEKPAFRVNGEIIPANKFQEEVNRRLSIVERKNPQEMEGDKAAELRAETKRQVATEMIRETLMSQQADKLGVTASGDVVSTKLEEQRLLQGIDEFERILKSQGLTEEQYRKTIEQQVLVDELGRKVCESVSCNDEELESFYLTHKNIFIRGEMVHAAHILLDTESEANAVLQQLKAGRDFSSVAKVVSRDEATRRNGGDLGWIEHGTMDPAFEQAAFSLDTGQTSEVVAASRGFHVIKVIERREAYEPLYKDVKQEVKDTYISENKETVFSDWLKTVYADADVELKGNIGKWDPLTGMVKSN